MGLYKFVTERKHTLLWQPKRHPPPIPSISGVPPLTLVYLPWPWCTSPDPGVPFWSCFTPRPVEYGIKFIAKMPVIGEESVIVIYPRVCQLLASITGILSRVTIGTKKYLPIGGKEYLTLTLWVLLWDTINTSGPQRNTHKKGKSSYFYKKNQQNKIIIPKDDKQIPLKCTLIGHSW